MNTTGTPCPPNTLNFCEGPIAMNFARSMSAMLLTTIPLLAHSLPGPQLAPATLISPANNNINRINTADMARASDGRSVVAWAEEGFIYIQRINADGSLNGTRINGNALGTGSVRDLQIAIDNSANFAIMYTKGFEQEAITYFRRFNADGSPETQEYENQSSLAGIDDNVGFENCQASRFRATSFPSLDMDTAGNVAFSYSVGLYCGSTIISNELRYRYLPKNGVGSVPIQVGVSVPATERVPYNFISHTDIQNGLAVVLHTRKIAGTNALVAQRYDGTTASGNTVEVIASGVNAVAIKDIGVLQTPSGGFVTVWNGNTFNPETNSFSPNRVFLRRFGANNTASDSTPVQLAGINLLALQQEADGDYAIVMTNNSTWLGQRFAASGGDPTSLFSNGFYLTDYDNTTPIALSKRLASNDYEVLYNRDDDDTEPFNRLHAVRYGGPEGTPKLTMQLSKNPIVAGMGDQIILRWISNVVGPFNNGTCQATGNWGGFVAPTGTRDLGFFTVAGDRTYRLICGQNALGLVQQVTLNVQGTEQPLPTPTVSISLSPNSINSGSAAQINWSTTNATTCEASGAWSGSKATSGSESTGTLNNPGTLTYTLTCRNQGGPTATQSAELQVQADTAPNLFSFQAATNINPGTMVESNIITISGINGAAPVSVVGGSYRINGGQYTSAAGTISNGNTLQLQTTAGNTPGATSTATVNVGGVEASFTSTTRMPDNASTATVNDSSADSVEFMTNEGTLNNLRTVPTPQGAPTTREYPNGFFAFNIDNVTAGGTVTVMITLPTDARPTSYVKCNDAGTSCADFAGATFNNNVVVLTLTDNGAGDTDPRLGFIADPGAPAVTPVAAGGAGTPSTASTSGGGGSLNAMLLPLVGLLLWQVRRKSLRTACKQ